MNLLANIEGRLTRLATFAELTAPAGDLPSTVLELSDSSVIEIAKDLAGIANDVARLQALVAGVAAHRSQRTAGHRGLAATQGHATPASLIQAITGGTKADATRQVRVGVSLLEDAVGSGSGASTETDTVGVVPPPVAWHTPLREALLDRRLTSAQHDAIRRGLGQPLDESADANDVWSVAACQLIDEAGAMTVEDLGTRARAMRDALDTVGAEERYARRYSNRSFRTWVDGDGQHHGRITFDDEMGLWVQAMRDAALRPRRGGPRFLTEEERTAAAKLVDDPRTNDQLQYDLFMAVLRAGSLAEAKDVFGARQPGVRMIVVKDPGSGVDAGRRDAFGRLLAVGYAEEGGQALPGSVIDRNLCMNGSTEITVDACGNPLDVGHEKRLFTSAQRIALTARDGGCMWPACAMPASYCESHHIDHVADGGRTDIDRGILLCRYHHLLLHNRGWRIRRAEKRRFVLHPPPDVGEEPIILASKASWKWAWDPPPPPTRSGWRAA
ncbi:DUF222 domain-containing protein [Microbacterium sp. NPDC055357]